MLQEIPIHDHLVQGLVRGLVQIHEDHVGHVAGLLLRLQKVANLGPMHGNVFLKLFGSKTCKVLVPLHRLHLVKVAAKHSCADASQCAEVPCHHVLPFGLRIGLQSSEEVQRLSGLHVQCPVECHALWKDSLLLLFLQNFQRCFAEGRGVVLHVLAAQVPPPGNALHLLAHIFECLGLLNVDAHLRESLCPCAQLEFAAHTKFAAALLACMSQCDVWCHAYANSVAILVTLNVLSIAGMVQPCLLERRVHGSTCLIPAWVPVSWFLRTGVEVTDHHVAAFAHLTIWNCSIEITVTTSHDGISAIFQGFLGEPRVHHTQANASEHIEHSLLECRVNVAKVLSPSEREAHVNRDCMTVVHGRRLSQLIARRPRVAVCNGAPLVVLMEVGAFQLQHAENSLVAKLAADGVQSLWALGAVLSNVKVTKLVFQ